MLTAEAAPAHSPAWLALRVLDEPSLVFHELSERPRALVPIVMLIISGLVVGFGMPESVLKSAAEQQLRGVESRQEEALPPTVRLEAVNRSVSGSGRTLVAGAAVANGLMSLAFTSAVLLLVFNATTGAAIRFREEWAIAAHAFIPWIIGTLLTVIMIAVLNDPSFKISLGFLVGPDRHPFLRNFADQFSFFGAWNMYLLAIGNHIRIGGSRLHFVMVVVGSFWLVINLVAAGIATAFMAMVA